MKLKFILCTLSFLLQLKNLQSQCAGPIINAEFSNDMAILDRNEAIFTATEPTDISLISGGLNFQLYINNVLLSGGAGTAQTGQVVKIIPHTVGSETILIVSATCGIFIEENTVIQCGEEVINAAFPDDIAVIGQDEAVFTVFETTGINLFGGSSNFNLFINNVLQSGGTGTALDGDEVKILPHTVGNEIIFINGSICGVFEEENTVVSNPLPIFYLKSPSATIKNNQCDISWSVASQVNNSHFIIDHSKDGRSYSEIGNVHGHGTISQAKKYNYIHKSPSIGINYYRIKQVDYDGKYSYSDIASVRYDGNGEMSIYPNPATSEVTISTTEPTSVQIFDVYGKLLLNRDISDGQNTINISALPSGILIFVVGDQRYRVLKVKYGSTKV